MYMYEVKKQTTSNYDQVVQRIAIWPLNNGRVDNPVPVEVIPGGNYLERQGGVDQRMYNTLGAARNAARANTNWQGGALSSRTANADPAGAGFYQYNFDDAGGANNIIVNDTAVVARHDKDPNAIIVRNGANARNLRKVRHYHAGTIVHGSNIHGRLYHGNQPDYDPIGGVEHYLINPIIDPNRENDIDN